MFVCIPEYASVHVPCACGRIRIGRHKGKEDELLQLLEEVLVQTKKAVEKKKS